MDGHCGKKEADRPRRRRRRRLDERITSNRFVYLCIFFLFCISFPSTTGGIKRLDGQQKTKREKRKTI
jgi:hypothetical protein